MRNGNKCQWSYLSTINPLKERHSVSEPWRKSSSRKNGRLSYNAKWDQKSKGWKKKVCVSTTVWGMEIKVSDHVCLQSVRWKSAIRFRNEHHISLISPHCLAMEGCVCRVAISTHVGLTWSPAVMEMVQWVTRVPDYLTMAERRDLSRMLDCWEGFICRVLKGDDSIAAMSSCHNVRHTLLPCQWIFSFASLNWSYIRHSRKNTLRYLGSYDRASWAKYEERRPKRCKN